MLETSTHEVMTSPVARIGFSTRLASASTSSHARATGSSGRHAAAAAGDGDGGVDGGAVEEEKPARSGKGRDKFVFEATLDGEFPKDLLYDLEDGLNYLGFARDL